MGPLVFVIAPVVLLVAGGLIGTRGIVADALERERA